MLIVACLYFWQAQSGEQIIGECYIQCRTTAYPPLFMAASCCLCVFRSIRSRIGIEVRSAIRIHSINRELNFFYR
ncbi:hypothetical protein, partial [Escherichia coli]|uniref:hypothetical protein n=1 Tax=Escherichia coli TaxID=562 RepID=UPI0022475FCE